MTYHDILTYVNTFLVHIPLWHWIVIAMLSLALTIILPIRRSSSTYGAFAFGISVFVGLFLLDSTVLIRSLSSSHQCFGVNLMMEYHRLLHGGEARWIEMLCNVIVFVPIGFFLSEFLLTTAKYLTKRRIGAVCSVAFGFSLLIESLQLFFRVGVFELTDIVLNTTGAFIGAALSVVGRMAFGIGRIKPNDH